MPVATNRSKRIRQALLGLFTLAAILAVSYVVHRFRSPVRHFPPGMKLEVAQSILDAAVLANDSDKYRRIVDEAFIEIAVADLRISYRQIDRAWQRSGLAGLFELPSWLRIVRINRSTDTWRVQLMNSRIRNRPRLFDIASEEIERHALVGHSDQPLPIDGDGLDLIDKIRDMRAAQRSRMQLQGEAADILLNVFSRSASPQALIDWITAVHFESNANDKLKQAKEIESMALADPDHPVVRRALGLLRWKQDRYAEAEPLLRESAMIFEADPLGRFAWAECCRQLKIDFDPVTLMGPPIVSGLHQATQESARSSFLALLHLSRDELQQAIEFAERATRLAPYDPSSWKVLAKVRSAASDPEGVESADARYRELSYATLKLRHAAMDFRSQNGSAESREALDAAAEILGLPEIGDWTKFVRFPDSLVDRKEIKFESVPDRRFMPRPVMKQAGES